MKTHLTLLVGVSLLGHVASAIAAPVRLTNGT